MKSFSQTNDCCKRKFIGVELTPMASAQLRAWCRFNGFDLTKSHSGRDIKDHEFGFHVTVMYTETYHDTQSGMWKFEPFDLDPIGFDMFGEGEHRVPVIVLNPNTPGLVALRKSYESLGMKDKWDDYRPHISLSYNYTGSDLSVKTLPSFRLSVNRLKIENKG